MWLKTSIKDHFEIPQGKYPSENNNLIQYYNIYLYYTNKSRTKCMLCKNVFELIYIYYIIIQYVLTKIVYLLLNSSKKQH